MVLFASAKLPFVVAAFHCREAAKALKARSMIAQGKRAEGARRPGYNGNYVRVPRPLWPQSAKLTGAKGAMELIPAFYVAPCQRSFRSPFQGSYRFGPLTQGGAPCGRLPWAILGRAFGAQNPGERSRERSRERSQINSSSAIAGTLSEEHWSDQSDQSDPSDPSDPSAKKEADQTDQSEKRAFLAALKNLRQSAPSADKKTPFSFAPAREKRVQRVLELTAQRISPSRLRVRKELERGPADTELNFSFAPLREKRVPRPIQKIICGPNSHSTAFLPI